MRIDLWEDIICSFCGVANGRISRALERFGHAQDLHLVRHSFRLMPDFPEGESMAFPEYLLSQGTPEAAVHQMGEAVESMAHGDGLTEYHVLDNHVGNTTLAHEFLHWAGSQGTGESAWQLLFAAHFGASRAPLWTIDDLLAFAEPLGLDATEARAVLTDRRLRPQVERDQAIAAQIGANGVPFMVIDARIGISGAQSEEAFVSALQQAWDSREDAR